MSQIDTPRPGEALGYAGQAFRRVRRGGAWWNDQHVRSLLYQAAVVLGVIVVVGWFASNAIANLARAGIATGFGFLGREASFGIGESLIDYSPANTYGYALVVGFLNTIKVAVVGCFLTTILGTFLGILRLTSNPLLSRLMSGYIEIVRNVPLLLQLFFWYAMVISLPQPRQSLSPFAGVFLSNRGIKVPGIVLDPSHWWVAGAFALGVAGTVWLLRTARARQEATGERMSVLPGSLGMLIAFPLVVGLVVGAPFDLDVPELKGFNFSGGLTLSPEFAALLIGLTVYTSAYVAEIVRAGIQAVNKGQWEAASALGFKRPRVLRLIVLPQALRIIVPPMTSTYLNYTKNSSLAIAIGYPDLVSVANTTMNQTGQAVEAIVIFMSVYLTLSLLISAFMNWYNRRIAMRER
jgi:general L-amino acid transport system permease protein